MRYRLRGAAALVIAFGSAACSIGGQAIPGPSGASSASPAASSQSPEHASEVPSMTETPSPAASSAFALTSTAFGEGDAIPREFSCDGTNVSPPLSWTGVPSGAAALVLVVDDPDARGFVHWIVLDLAGADGNLPKGVSPTADSPQQGRNDFGDVGWGGPCPPSGTHRYRFTLTAIAAPLGLAGDPNGQDVAAALAAANVLGQATLSATYRRS
jgi:Raf kinase inhibitor-like YbhB/YbcL family protein